VEGKRYLALIRRWFWLIIIGTLIAVAGSFALSGVLPKTYQASTTLLIGPSLQSISPSMPDLQTSERLARTYAELVKRQPILAATIQTLGLPFRPHELARQVTVRTVPETQLVELRVADTEPARAQRTADELARQLILQTPTGVQKAPADRQQFVEGQMLELERRIIESDLRLGELQQRLEVLNDPANRQELQAEINGENVRATSLRSAYSMLVTFLSSSSINYISVVEPATLPAVPISPNVPLNLLLAAAVGLIVTISAALLLEYLDETVKSPEEVQHATGLATLGVIGRIAGKQVPQTVVAAAPRSWVLEGYRSLRTNLQFFSLEGPLRTLLVSSANPAEGKSTTVANLAVVMAQAGLKVVVVDADLRRPSLNRFFGLDNARGLSNALLESDPDPARFLQDTEYEHLQLLSGGPPPPNPSELIAHARMRALIEKLQACCDIAIFDSPPVLAVTDPVVLARQVDGVLLVVGHASTRLAALAKARDELTRVGSRVLGVAMNRVSDARFDSAYYYYDEATADVELNGRRGLRRIGHRLRGLVPGMRRA
jgi:capsular exopolysaccharide synthesis family protein